MSELLFEVCFRASSNTLDGVSPDVNIEHQCGLIETIAERTIAHTFADLQATSLALQDQRMQNWFLCDFLCWDV